MPQTTGGTPSEDPLIGPMFYLDLGNNVTGYFTECAGLGSETEVITQHVVGEKGVQILKRIPGNLKYEDITLKRGVTPDLQLWAWRKLVEDGKVGEARCDGSVTMYTQEGDPIATWEFYNAWPVKVSGPQLSAGSNEVALEELRITHEGMKRMKI
jgi:phage tail-like protein